MSLCYVEHRVSLRESYIAALRERYVAGWISLEAFEEAVAFVLRSKALA